MAIYNFFVEFHYNNSRTQYIVTQVHSMYSKKDLHLIGQHDDIIQFLSFHTNQYVH